MSETRYYPPLRWFSHVVLLLMAVAVLYAAFIAVRYWSGIGV